MLLALDRMKSTRPKVSLHVRRYNAAQLPQALLTDPVMAGSQVIISTADRDFPAGLAEYASRNGKTAINVFDAKSDLYTQPGVMQLLPPSADFYASCADYLLADKGNSKYIFLAEDDADGETLSLILLERLIREGKRYETLPAYDDLVNYSYAPADSYVIVSDLSKRADLNKLATIMEKVIAANPAATFSVVGRPPGCSMAMG